MSLSASLSQTPMYDGAGHLSYPWIKFFNQVGAAAAVLAYGSRAQRLAQDPGASADGSLWLESDTGLVYRVQYIPGAVADAEWQYFAGTWEREQGQLAALSLALRDVDAGLLVEVTDFRHILRWSGSAWGWGPGEDGRHEFVDMPIAPDDLTGWQLCDGTVTSYLKGNGKTAAFTTPDLTAGAVRIGGAYTGTVNPAAATVTLTGDTDDEDTHVHSIEHDHPAATSGVNSTGQNLLTPNTGAGIAAGNGHSHSVDIPDLVADSGPGAAHHHGLSAVTAALSGDVIANIAVLVYFRR
jgi:hypothetical protein